MGDKQIEELLKSADLSEIESSIVNNCRTYVNMNHLKFTINIIRREVTNAGMTIEDIRQLLKSNKDSLIKLGTQILNESLSKPHIEEYPTGEKPNEPESTSVEDAHGIGIGFGIKYAIYLHFLLNKTEKELVDYLKRERIPNVKKFSNSLTSYSFK